MKDAKGHGSNSKGGTSYADATAAVAHQAGVNKIPQTPEAYIQTGGKLPTAAQHNEFIEGRTLAIKGWGDVSNNEFGKAAVARMQGDVDRSKASVARFGTEDNPSAETLRLRGIQSHLASDPTFEHSPLTGERGRRN